MTIFCFIRRLKLPWEIVMLVSEAFDPSMYFSVTDAPLKNKASEIFKGCGGKLLVRTPGVIAELDTALTEDPRVVCRWEQEDEWMMQNENSSHKIVTWEGDMGRGGGCGPAIIKVDTRYNCLYIMWEDAKGGGMRRDLLAGRPSLEGATIDGDTRNGKDGPRFNKPLAILQAGGNSFWVGEAAAVRELVMHDDFCEVKTLGGGGHLASRTAACAEELCCSARCRCFWTGAVFFSWTSSTRLCAA